MKSMVKGLIKRAGISKDSLAAARLTAERHVMARLPLGPVQRTSGRILCYHAIGQPELGVNDATPEQFRAHIEYALAAGYTFVPASHIADTGGASNELAISFDDALRSLKTHAFPILAEYNIPWTFFAVSGWTENGHPWGPDVVLNWDEINALREAGVVVGSHSASHANFGTLPEAEFEAELVGSRALFQQRLGFLPEDFAIPLGQSHNWRAAAHEAAKAAGYARIYAQAEQTRFPGTIPRTFVTRADNLTVFKALLNGRFDQWEEWVWH